MDFNKDIEPSSTYERKWKNKLFDYFYSKIKPYIGCTLALISAFCFSLGGIFYIKAISMSGSDNSVFRFFVQFISMICVLKYKNIGLLGPKDQQKLLIARAVFGIFAVLFANFAIKYIDISDSTATYLYK